MARAAALPLDRVVPTFMLALEAEGRSPATRRAYGAALRRFREAADVQTLAEMGPEHLDQLLVSLRRSGAKPATLACYHAALRAFARFCLSRELLDRDPFAGVRPPHHRLKQRDGFSEDELGALLAATSPRTLWGARDRAILVVFYATGLRLAELCGLRRDDLEGGRQQLIRIHGKGGKERLVALTATCREAVAHYLMLRDDACPALFVSRQGGPLQPDGVRVLIYRLGRRAGVKNAHPHRFRNTALADMLRSGMSEAEVMRIAGHSQLAMLQHYVGYAEQVRANDRLLAADHVARFLPLPGRKAGTKPQR